MESCAFLSLLNVNNKFSQHLHVNNKETSFLKCSILFCCTEKIEQSKNTLHCFFLLCSMRNAFRTNEKCRIFFCYKKMKNMEYSSEKFKMHAYKIIRLHFECSSLCFDSFWLHLFAYCHFNVCHAHFLLHSVPFICWKMMFLFLFCTTMTE